MRQWLRSHLTYANVMATIAVFIALGGGTTAVALNGSNTVQSDDLGPGAQVKAADLADNAVNSAEIANGQVKNPDILNGAVTTNKLRDGSVGNADLGPDSVTGAKVLDDSLTGAKINESTLATVPSATQATNAEHVNGKTAAELEGARAYAVVRGNLCGGSPSFCPLVRNKEVAYAVHVANGRYCVGVDGINNATSLAVVTLLNPGPDTWARWRGPDGNVDCVGSEFEVWTGIAQNPAKTDFTIVIP